jgi:phosphohistidine swiveling domain-containing protein
MTRQPFVLPLEACRDGTLVGGKAAGLSRLIGAGFPVPSGCCLTTRAYGCAVEKAGLDLGTEWSRLQVASDPQRASILEAIRGRILLLHVPDEILGDLHRCLGAVSADPSVLWAVRSSAREEDSGEASFGGLFRTTLGATVPELPAAIVQCWASLWTLPAWLYRQAMVPHRSSHRLPEMAVVLQPLLKGRAGGVLYSRHPLSGDSQQVVVDAVVGLAEPMVDGRAVPDHFVIGTPSGSTPMRLLERRIAEKRHARVAGPAGVEDLVIPEENRHCPAVMEEHLFSLAALGKRVEQQLGHAVDLEWVIDEAGIWLLQARPIVVRRQAVMLAADGCVWSRANFRETLPEVPSPLAVSLLQDYMETNILAHYRAVGCRIPPGVSSVRVLWGRPYINVTLSQALVQQLGGDAGEVIDLMGGEPVPEPPGIERLPWWRLVRAALRLGWSMLRAPRVAPGWFRELKQIGLAQEPSALEGLGTDALLDRLYSLNDVVRRGDLTFACVAAVSHALRMLRLVLQRRLPKEWRPLLNAATQGFGTIISARQISWLMRLAILARQDPAVREFLVHQRWLPDFDRSRLAGTAFLAELDAFLAEYGHRGIGESDFRAPRFAEQPGYLLGIIHGHLVTPAAPSWTALEEEQVRARQAALRSIRRAFGWRLHEWLWFRYWHRALCRAQALREENRHYLMYYVAGIKRIFLQLAARLMAQGHLQAVDELFFLHPDEIRLLVAGRRGKDWKQIIAQRRAQMAQDEARIAPNVIFGGAGLEQAERPAAGEESGRVLTGLPVSSGHAEGPVRLVASGEDYARVQRGDILVMPVLDPGLAPLMGLAGGLIVEMGGMLSHGAIIAREFGIPALANVREAMTRLKEGERVMLDTARGEIRPL